MTRELTPAEFVAHVLPKRRKQVLKDLNKLFADSGMKFVFEEGPRK